MSMNFIPGDGKMCVVSVRPGHKAIKKLQYFFGNLSNKHLNETKAIQPKLRIYFFCLENFISKSIQNKYNMLYWESEE